MPIAADQNQPSPSSGSSEGSPEAKAAAESMRKLVDAVGSRIVHWSIRMALIKTNDGDIDDDDDDDDNLQQ